MEPQNGLIFIHVQERGDPRPATWAVLTRNGLRSSLGGLWGAQAVAGRAGGWPKDYGAGLVRALSAGLVPAQVREEDADGNAYRWEDRMANFGFP